MAQCEFLFHEDKKTCSSCRGYFCLSKGGKLKLGVTEHCKNKWDDCPRFLEVYPKPAEERDFVSTADYAGPVEVEEEKPKKKKSKKKKPTKKKATAKVTAAPMKIVTPSTDCPYLGPIPTGCAGCCDVWCYADAAPLRTYKHCKSPPTWLECRSRIRAEKAGIKYAGA